MFDASVLTQEGFHGFSRDVFAPSTVFASGFGVSLMAHALMRLASVLRALSERERAILRVLSGSLSERDIGRELYLSPNTVHGHTRSIYRRLGVSSRAEAIERACSIGLL